MGLGVSVFKFRFTLGALAGDKIACPTRIVPHIVRQYRRLVEDAAGRLRVSEGGENVCEFEERFL